MLAATVSAASVSVVVVVVVVLPAVAPFLYLCMRVCVCVWVLFGEFERSFQSLGDVVLAREPVIPTNRRCLNRDVEVYIMLSNTDGLVFLRPGATKVLPFRSTAQDDQRVLRFRRNSFKRWRCYCSLLLPLLTLGAGGDARSENRGFCLKTTAHTAAKKSASMRVRAGQQ